jgi:hypothetical protein
MKPGEARVAKVDNCAGWDRQIGSRIDNIAAR